MNILNFVFETVIFALFILWFNFLPGLIFVKIFKGKLPTAEIMAVSLVTGVTIFTLFLYIFGCLKLGFLAYILISIINVYFLVKLKQKKNMWFGNFLLICRKSWITVVIIALLTLFAGSLLFRSGLLTDGQLSFTESRDSFWHLGLMQELVRSVPPIHPGFAGLPLTNYHIFTHLFGSGFLHLGIFNNLDFYYRLFPFFIVFLYVITLFVLGRLLTGRKLGGILSSVFGVMTGSFAYLLPLFIKYPGFVWQESSFWLSQPFSMIINPSFALSSSWVLVSLYLIHKIETGNKNLWPILSLIAGVTIVFKVYAGILILMALFGASLWQLITRKESSLFKSFCVALVISLVLFLPQNGSDAGKFLVFMPGWFLRSMVESPDRVQIVDWILRENTYAEHGNTFAIFRYRFVELLMYLAGNLGVRVLGFITVFSLVKNFRKLSGVSVAMLIVFFAGMTVPLLFVQDGSIANTLQFSYYALEIMSVFTAMWILKIFNKYGKRAGILTVIILLVLAVPTSLNTWYHYLIKNTPQIIPAGRLQSYEFLKKNTDEKSVIMVPGTPTFLISLEAGTLSNRRLYYGDRLMAENTHKNFKEREAVLQKFYKSTNDTGWNNAVLHDNQIDYVYVDKNETKEFLPEFYSLTQVFENNSALIYQVIR